MVSLSEFYDMLENHNWFYEFSDQTSTWVDGDFKHSEIRRMANTSKEHKQLYDNYKRYVFSGEPWGIDKIEKPKRPCENQPTCVK